jgi:predicted nucleic acid-binding protein
MAALSILIELLAPAFRLMLVHGEHEARAAATLYRSATGSHRRQADIAIAACAIEDSAAIWTLNPKDFRDIPGLTLYPGS